jgi:hypothetical protein
MMAQALSAQEIERQLRAMEYVESQLRTDELERQTNIKGWGQWVSGPAGGRSLGYAASVWHKEVVTGYRKSREQHPITDEDAIKIDRIVASMRFRDGRWLNVLVGLYAKRMSLRSLAEECRCDKGSIVTLRDNALSYLLGKLDNP